MTFKILRLSYPWQSIMRIWLKIGKALPWWKIIHSTLWLYVQLDIGIKKKKTINTKLWFYGTLKVTTKLTLCLPTKRLDWPLTSIITHSNNAISIFWFHYLFPGVISLNVVQLSTRKNDLGRWKGKKKLLPHLVVKS